MEKGTLYIVQAKSGKYIARITFTKSDGKPGTIDAQFWSPTKDDLRYDNTPCEFERDKGQLIKIKTHDGQIFEKQTAPTPAVSNTDTNTSDTNSSISDSYKPNLTLLPADTKNALAHINPDNFALKWQKAARYVEGQTSDKSKFMFFKRERKGDNFEIRPNYGQIDFEQIARRELANAKAILGDNEIKTETFITHWRLTQGLGIESVYETSMTLHHVYGIPYIPASSLKGIVRSWIIVNAYESREEKALSDSRFCDWFGCPGELVVEDKNGQKCRYSSFYKEARRGKLVFFDTYPLRPPRLKTDVMNPHYGPYYSDKTGNTPPADYHNPVPVFFLTVEETPFQFILGGKKDVLKQTIRNKSTGQNLTIFDWLKDALQSHGIGAKTAVGYGYMKEQP